MKKIDEGNRRVQDHELPVGPELEEVLEVAWEARTPVLLEGPTGIGKSEVMSGLARRLGIGFAVLDLSLLEPPDLVGLPVIADGLTTYAPPSSLPRDGRGILALEELNRAERPIRQPALQLLTARRLHEYELPAGWVCFAAVNPERDEYDVTPLDRALRARFLQVSVRADRLSWIGWARENGVHAAILRLAESHDAVFDDVPPRTWTFASRVLSVMTRNPATSRRRLKNVLRGYLPAAWAELVLADEHWLAPDDGLDPRRCIAAFDGDESLRAALDGIKQRGRTDLLAQLCGRVRSILESPELPVRIQKGEFRMEAFESLIRELPGDERSRLQDAFGRQPASTDLIELKPADVLRQYKGGTAERKVKGWVKDPLRRHRAAALVTAVDLHVRQLGDQVRKLRDDRHARICLGEFMEHVGSELAAPLERTLQSVGVDPMRPGRDR